MKKKAAFTFSELCRECGKSALYLRNIQSQLNLPALDKPERYPAGYLCFVKKTIFLQAFGVPLKDIAELLAREKSLLQMLKLDGLSDSRTWYLDQCGADGGLKNRLLLTGYSVDCAFDAHLIQPNLDFAEREKELFRVRETDADIRRAFDGYCRMVAAIKSRIRREKPVLRAALKWSRILA